MHGPNFKAELRLLATDQGGRTQPVFTDYRPNWDLGNTWLGEPQVNDGRVVLDVGTEIPPGATGLVRIEPVRSEFWADVRPGHELAVQEGAHVVGYARILEVTECPTYWTPAVARFVRHAWQFCDFVEKAHLKPLAVRIELARRCLLELYAGGLELPQVVPPEGIEAGPSPEPPAHWEGFDAFEFYWEVFDPYQEDAPVTGSLSDDLLDVYRDLRPGLALWEVGDADHRLAAIWEWRFHFGIHWGDHAIDALRALHRVRPVTAP